MMQKIQTLPPAFRTDISPSRPRTHGARGSPLSAGPPLLAIGRVPAPGYGRERPG